MNYRILRINQFEDRNWSGNNIEYLQAIIYINYLISFRQMTTNISSFEAGNIDFDNHGFITFFGNSNADLIINDLEGMLNIS